MNPFPALQNKRKNIADLLRRQNRGVTILTNYFSLQQQTCNFLAAKVSELFLYLPCKIVVEPRVRKYGLQEKNTHKDNNPRRLSCLKCFPNETSAEREGRAVSESCDSSPHVTGSSHVITSDGGGGSKGSAVADDSAVQWGGGGPAPQ